VRVFLFTTLPTNDLGLLARSLPIAHELATRDHRLVFSSPAPAPGKVLADAGSENLLSRHPLYHFMAVTLGLPGFLAAKQAGWWEWGSGISSADLSAPCPPVCCACLGCMEHPGIELQEGGSCARIKDTRRCTVDS
jgi:hypothetical protein